MNNNWYKINKRKWLGLVEELEVTCPVMVKTNLRPAYPIEEDTFRLNTDGVLWLFVTYRWDGMSFITFDRKRGKSRKTSAVHDCLYYILRKYEDVGFTREQADRMFHILGMWEGMNKTRIDTCYQAVRVGGGIWMFVDKKLWR